MKSAKMIGAIVPLVAIRKLDRIASADPLRPTRSQLLRRVIEEFIATHDPPRDKGEVAAA